MIPTEMDVKPNLNAQSEVPLYRQLSEHFKILIDTGLVDRGERLPATRELAGQLGLNRTTVSAAYELLEEEGYISGQVGRGSFVTGGGGRDAGLNWDSVLSAPQVAMRPSVVPGPLISFATSRPSEKLFPLDKFRASCEDVLGSADLASILQLGSPGGYEPLRQYLLDEARTEGVAGPGDDVMITNGCQQALDLIRRVLVRPGDRVGLEDPVYPGLKNLFLQAGADLCGVPVGAEGIDLERLQRVRPKLLMVTPNFQNPTGATIPLESRKSILRMSRDSGTVVVENDMYGSLRYEGKAQPTLKALDTTGDTILLRSFSKISFPGLRVGWVVGPKTFISRMLEAKQLSDLHTDQFSQAVLLRFAQSGRLEAHQANMLVAGAERLLAVRAACELYLPQGARFSRPQGGMNLWITLPEPLDSADLLPRAQRAGVTYLPGRFFAVSEPHAGGLRLSFAGLDPKQIEEGVRLLGHLFSEELDAHTGFDHRPAPAMV